MGAFSRQEMINNSTSNAEVYSLGVNDRLGESHIEKLAKLLENNKEKTHEIAKSVIDKTIHSESSEQQPTINKDE